VRMSDEARIRVGETAREGVSDLGWYGSMLSGGRALFEFEDCRDAEARLWLIISCGCWK